MKRVQAKPDNEPEHLPKEPEKLPSEQQEEEPKKEWNVFPEEHVQALRGLLFLGQLEKDVEYAGHTFTMHTLTEGDILRVGQLTGKYRGTLVEVESQRVFLVAAAVDYVDGLPLSQPISEDYDAIYEKSRVVKQWFPAVVHGLYDEYSTLEKTAIDVSNALKK
jgi:hypothetical protein